MLAWTVASEFTWDAAIQSKLGRRAADHQTYGPPNLNITSNATPTTNLAHNTTNQESETLGNPDLHPDTHNDLGYSDTALWEDIPESMNKEEAASLAHIRSIHQRLIQEQKYQNWKDVLEILFPIYLHLKNLTANWTLPPALDDHSGLLCNCPPGTQTVREVDLIDLMGQKQGNFKFCSCTPDPALLLANGYLSSTPIFPQTAFSV
ncbi:hypothetical protein PCANC_26466 [Puccinia coronata f. sp. avenae]|uniref:CxC1-like cysteine cluster associated with KDZ transposases domain-containing protein n=1 Tax=Puccinia coronata f. sp. avenae TaxID=200324 RepID=A0A2N5TRC0_9BASI|nr:hypothetical protein PCANC_26466 [Puccinia coronata f. sp. avenae]